MIIDRIEGAIRHRAICQFEPSTADILELQEYVRHGVYYQVRPWLWSGGGD
jgi:hypothetical protein